MKKIVIAIGLLMISGLYSVLPDIYTEGAMPRVPSDVVEKRTKIESNKPETVEVTEHTTTGEVGTKIFGIRPS